MTEVNHLGLWCERSLSLGTQIVMASEMAVLMIDQIVSTEWEASAKSKLVHSR